MLLDGKVAIITGVGAGLGGAAAEAFAREGAAVALVARTESNLEEVAGKIEADGGRALVVPGSVSDAGRCLEIAAAVADKLGGIDCLVNSAFRNDPGVAFEDADLDQWRKVFDVNVFGTLNMIQAAIPHLKARGGGSIVNIGSMGARKIRPNSGAYTASKGASADGDAGAGQGARPVQDSRQHRGARLDLGSKCAVVREPRGRAARRLTG